MKFNEKLIEIRKKGGLSQEEFGYKLNVTRQTVSKWELGQTTPEMDKLAEISKFFNVSVDELIKDTEINRSENVVNDIWTEKRYMQLCEKYKIDFLQDFEKDVKVYRVDATEEMDKVYNNIFEIIKQCN